MNTELILFVFAMGALTGWNIRAAVMDAKIIHGIKSRREELDRLIAASEERDRAFDALLFEAAQWRDRQKPRS
jgi:hypothetical protein